MARVIAAAALLSAALACDIPVTGPTMAAGEDCIHCHQDVAPTWTIAGTVYSAPDAKPDAGLEGAAVLVNDSAGKQLTLTTNSVGNFYTAEPLTWPIRVEIQHGTKRMAMSDSPPRGSCNACHTLPRPPGEEDVPGHLFVPK
jgi:hypothetical protein